MKKDPKISILSVDDDDVLRSNMVAYLEDSGYKLFEGRDGLHGLEVFHKENPDLVLLDLRMPGMDGLEVLSRITDDSPETPVIVVSGAGMQQDTIDALHNGAWDFITKPVKDMAVLEHAIQSAMEKVNLRKQLMQQQITLEEKVKARTHALHDITVGAINSLAMTTEMRDPYTAGHQRRVAKIAAMMANAMGIKTERIETIEIAATLHDIGKVAIPIEILTKPGKLSKLEHELIHIHSEIGHQILENITFPGPVARIVREHHERMDGSGYPDGRSNNDILMETRIVSVADMLEAITAHRPYRAGRGKEKAIHILTEEKGRALDESVVDVCIELVSNGTIQFTKDTMCD